MELSNNNLTEPVPKFLSQLSSLKILKRNLGRNKLTGPLPVELIGKQKNNALELSLGVANNFERVPHKGRFGTVYHGQLVKSEVAMKMFSPSSSQGYKQFKPE
ncbi:hypothetical protein AB3S75_033582 [Citrus x aurantiifolia]